jgi:hypothetical protein
MKKVKMFFATLFVAGAMFSAQTVTAACTPVVLDSAGLDPAWQELACAKRGEAYTAVINVKNFSSVGAINVEWLRVDSLAPVYSGGTPQAFTGLPSGLSWTMTVPAGNDPGKLLTNEDGCIEVTGTTNAARGDYRIGIYVCVKASISPTPFCGEAEELVNTIGGLIGGGGGLPNFAYYARVIEANEACPDTFVTVGINELKTVSGLNVYPNPFSSKAVISFNSVDNAKYTARLVDVMGKEVYAETLVATAGTNRFELNRNAIAGGVYFFTLSDGKATTTKRVIVE